MDDSPHDAADSPDRTMNSPNDIDPHDIPRPEQREPAAEGRAPEARPETRPEARSESDGIPAEGSEGLMQAATARITALETELQEMRDKWMRAEAETQNVRTRGKREADDARQYAVQKFARDVVEAAENLRRGLSSLPPAGSDDSPIVTKLREGFEGVERSFVGILERNGVVSTDPTGAAFDANLHQAMAEQPSTDHPPGTVMQAWTSAWTLNGRLLKPAMVVVSKAPEAAAAEPAGLDRTV